MAIANRGFASMNPERRRELSSLGGRTAHRLGKAHEWTRDEARAAARKGRERTRRLSSPEGPASTARGPS